MFIKKILLSFSSLLLFTACGGDTESSVSDDIEKITASIPSSERKPCDYINEKMVRETFGVGDDFEITMNDSYGTCSFQWDGLTEAERTAADEEATSAMLSAIGSGNINISDLQKGYFNVSLNFTTAQITDAAGAARTFETINERMTKGIKVSADQVKEKTKGTSVSDEAVDKIIGDGVTFKGGERKDIDGVGDEAVWDTKLKQLTVLAGTDIFFVGSNAGGDAELSVEKAKELANKIIDKL